MENEREGKGMGSGARIEPACNRCHVGERTIVGAAWKVEIELMVRG